VYTESGNETGGSLSAQHQPLPDGGSGPDLCAQARALPIGTLQLGPKTRWLQAAGYQSVGDVADASADALRRVQAIGRSTIETICRRLDALRSASLHGSIDWKLFASSAGFPLIPETAVRSGPDMLSVLPAVLESLSPLLKDDASRDILANRLVRGPRDQATLEQIGLRAVPTVTRERIRQKEKKLLRQLSGALLWDDGGDLEIQFHPTFSSWWHRAAAEFDGVEEIGFDEFSRRLAAVWDVPVHALLEQIPFIIAIVTGEPQMSASFRAAVRLDPKLRQLDAAAGATPVLRFRLGRRGFRLAAAGIVKLEDLIAAASQGRLPHELDDQLAAISASVTETGSIDWDSYARAAGLPSIPAEPPADPDTFVIGFGAIICTLLDGIRPSDRAGRIFDLRTRHPAGSRMILEAVAAELSTHQPTVKREETELLQALHDVLLDHEFAEVPFWIDRDWLRYCAAAHDVFMSCDKDYPAFRSALSHHWRLPAAAVELAAPGLWAIFSGYPEGRPRKAAAADMVQLVPPEPGRIRLRGFRRVH
jgi:hypothetical protein